MSFVEYGCDVVLQKKHFSMSKSVPGSQCNAQLSVFALQLFIMFIYALALVNKQEVHLGGGELLHISVRMGCLVGYQGISGK